MIKDNLTKKLTLGLLVILSLVAASYLLGYLRSNLSPLVENNDPWQAETEAPMNGVGNEIYGVVSSKSDVTNEPNSPLQMLVLLLSSERLNLLLNDVGATPEQHNNPAKLGLTITKKILDVYFSTFTTSLQNGEYKFTKVASGKHFLCVAETNSSTQSEEFEAFLMGCLEVTVPENQKVEKNLYLQFGWVTSD